MIIRRWVRVCSLRQLEPGRGVAALVDGRQLALFLLPGAQGEPASRLRAIDNRDPASGVNVLSRGLLGSTDGVDYVASPMHKHRFDLATGRCLDGSSPGVRVWPVRVWGSTVEVLSVTGEDDSPDTATDSAVTATHCPFCALQCGMKLFGTQATSMEVSGDAAFPVNQGRMCVKGWSSVDLLRSPERLAEPLIRQAGGELAPATWDDALDQLGARLIEHRQIDGPDSVGVFGSGALTNEKAYLLGKFARLALGTRNIDYNGRYCMSSAAAAQNQAFGIDRGLPFPLADIGGTDTLVLWGANPADTMPPLMAWIDQMHRRGGQLIVVDPRRSASAQVADIHLQPVPGTDLALALGLLRLAERSGAVDHDYLASRTTGWDTVLRAAAPWTPALVQSVSGVAPGDLERLLHSLVEPPAAMILTGRGPEQQAKGTDTVSALINLMLALGRVGRPHSGYGCLTGQANGQGGREHGQKADQLPGYRSISDPSDRAAVAAAWGVDPSAIPQAGLSAMEMISSIGEPGGLRALVVVGSDVATASPSAEQVRSRLAGLDTLVVLDSFLTDTAATADFVLPVTQWAEEDGTVTSLEGRVLRRRRALAPPPGVRSDIDILCALAARLGHEERFSFPGPESVFEELARASAGGRADYSGISYDRLDGEETIYWPCPDPTHPGTPRLFGETFAHEDGRGRLVPVSYRPAAEEPDDEYPVRFSTGRYREHYNSGHQTRRIDALRLRREHPILQIHPELARQSDLTDGDVAEVQSRRGSVRFRVELSTDIRPDTVFAPIHWSGTQAVNLLTLATLDPISRMPEFKLCAVRLAAVSGRGD